MFGSYLSWWLNRIAELLPADWFGSAAGERDAIVVEATPVGDVTAYISRRGQRQPVNLGAAARLAGQRPVLLKPPPDLVLVKEHSVPLISRREMQQLLRHELARITPFSADELFWRWDGRPAPSDRTRLDITLVMVPRSVLAPALDTLAAAGLQPDWVSTKFGLLPISEKRGVELGLTRVLALGCAVLAVIALVLPPILQEIALYRTNAAMADLQPAVTQVEAIRREVAAGDASRNVMNHEIERTGNVLQILATITRILPDDTYLTDFALRERHMTIGGRSASAPRLITALSADPAIRDTAFAAPVTRVPGTTGDAFTIKAEFPP